MEYTIFFPTALEKVDSLNDNVDVCVQLQNGKRYTFLVITPDNLKDLMVKDNVPYIKPCTPFLVVEEITEENIHQLIDEVLKENDVFLQAYGGNLLVDYRSTGDGSAC